MKSRIIYSIAIMDVQITIDDPKATTKPWTAAIKQHLLPDSLDPAHLVGK